MIRGPRPGRAAQSTRIVRSVVLAMLLGAALFVSGCDTTAGGFAGAALIRPAKVDQREFTPVPDGPEEAGVDSSADATPSLAPVPPHPVLPAFNRAAYRGRPVEFVPNDKREVALTFDDGPSANTTSVLSMLSAYGDHATFFFVGARAAVHDDLVVATVAQGSEVANHTWSHKALFGLDPSALSMQIDRAQAMLTAESGSAPVFVRPRGGKFDEAGRMAVGQRGLVLALWSIHANDVLNSPPPAELVKNATRTAKPGSIILMHETNPNTILALPQILEALRAKGLHPVTLSQLLADGRP